MTNQALPHPQPEQSTLKKWWFYNRDTVDGYLFLLPFLIVYLLFVIYPVIQAAYMSLYDWDLLSSSRKFIGMENYLDMLWGRQITWDLTHLWGWRLAALGLVILAWVAAARVDCAVSQPYG